MTSPSHDTSGPPKKIRITSGDKGADCSGLYLIESDRRKSAPCYTRDKGSGCLYYDGSYWKICQIGEGSNGECYFP